MTRRCPRRTRNLALLAGLALALAGPGAPRSEDRPGLIADGDTPDLFLLYTGDVIGYIDPCG